MPKETSLFVVNSLESAKHFIAIRLLCVPQQPMEFLMSFFVMNTLHKSISLTIFNHPNVLPMSTNTCYLSPKSIQPRKRPRINAPILCQPPEVQPLLNSVLFDFLSKGGCVAS